MLRVRNIRGIKLTMRLRLDDVIRVLGLPSNASLAELLPPNPKTGQPYSRSWISRCGEVLPELQSRQLCDKHPELRDHVLDPATGMSVADMRAKVQAEDGRG